MDYSLLVAVQKTSVSTDSVRAGVETVQTESVRGKNVRTLFLNKDKEKNKEKNRDNSKNNSRNDLSMDGNDIERVSVIKDDRLVFYSDAVNKTIISIFV